MIYYRLYFMNGSDHIERFHEFEAIDEEAAIRRSEMFIAGRAMELWHGETMLQRWDAPTVIPPQG